MSLRFYPVYINHIAESVSAPDLRSLFARVGNVIDVVIVDDYGFVNMSSAEDAFHAVEELNGRGLHSKLLHVDFSEEVKQALLSRGTTFRCTPDPYSGVVGEQHPKYPAGEGIVQPVLPDSGYVSLLDNKEYLDERLKMINAELDKLKDSSSTGSFTRGKRRSRSPRESGQRSSRRSRSRDSSRRSSRSTHQERQTIRDRHHDSRHSELSRPESRHLDSVHYDQERFRSSSHHQDRRSTAASERDRQHDEMWGRAEREEDHRYRRQGSWDRSRDYHHRRSRELSSTYDCRSRSPIAELEHYADERYQKEDYLSQGRYRSPTPNFDQYESYSRDRYRQSDYRDFADNDHQLQDHLLDHDTDSRRKPVHERLGMGTIHERLGDRYHDDGRHDDSDRDRRSYERKETAAILPEANLPEADAAENHDPYADEFENSPDMDMSKKNVKIKINIDSKSVDDMTRRIMIEEEKKGWPVFRITMRCQLDALPDLPGLEFELVSFETTASPMPATCINVKSVKSTAVHLFEFVSRVAPFGSEGFLMNEEDEYVGSTAPALVVNLPNINDQRNVVKMLSEPGSGQNDVIRKHGVLDRIWYNRKRRCVQIEFAHIFTTDLVKLLDLLRHELISEPLQPYVSIDTEAGRQVNQQLMEADPDGVYPFLLTVEGIRNDVNDIKYIPTIWNKVLDALEPHGGQYLVRSDTDEGQNVVILCTRLEAVEACLQLTNTFVVGNLLYVSAKNSQDNQLKEEVGNMLNEKFGKKLEELEEDLVTNRKESEEVDSSSDKPKARVIDLFVDGVQGNLNLKDFEKLFNNYGMVIGENQHKRYSFVTIVTTEEKALQAVEEVTGHMLEDTTLVVQISHKERNDLVNKSRQLVKQKLAEVRKKEQEEMERESKEHLGPGVKRYYFYLNGITRPMNKYEVATVFAPYGKVIRALATDNKNYSFIDVETTEEQAINAYLEITGREFYGNSVKVQFRNTKGMEEISRKAKKAAMERLRNANKAINQISRKRDLEEDYNSGGSFGKRRAFTEMEEQDLMNQKLNMAGPTTRVTPPPALGKVELPESMRALLTAPTSFQAERMEYPKEDPSQAADLADPAADDNLVDYVASRRDGLGRGAQRTSLEREDSSMDKVSWSNILAAVSSVSNSMEKKKDEGQKALRRFHIAKLSNQIREYDVKELFSNYGQINRVNLVKMTSGFVQAYMSELMAVKCVCELNGFFYKGTRIVVEFSKGSYEDTKEFREKWSEEFKLYSSQEHKNTVNIQPKIPKMKISEIGEGLKNFDMSLSLDAVHPSFQSQGGGSHQDSSRSQGYKTTDFGPVPAPMSQPLAPAPDFRRPPLTSSSSSSARPAKDSDPDFLTDVKGYIHSIQNKQILLEFSLPGSGEKALAKLIPGQMYINGRQCLGIAIKSNTYHMWPNNIKEFLQIGKEVWMDLKRLSMKEMHDSKDREKSIQWSAPFLRLSGFQVSDRELNISKHTQDSLITTAIVRNICVNWGILEAKDQKILFKNENFFWQTAPLKSDVSLSTVDMEVGDIVAVHVEESPEKVLQLVKTIQVNDTTAVSITGVKLIARLVWQVTAEVDPWVYTEPDSEAKINFLTSSSTLNRPLPGEKESEFTNISGTVDEIQLPGGGIISINADSAKKLNLSANASQQLKVYFHRSRVHLNGTKMLSDQCLDRELKPGDQVSMDIVQNTPYPSDPPFVMSPSFWVAVAVRANTVVRGVQIANRLKKEASVGCEEGVERARVVFLSPPPDPMSPVVSGTAVIDTGEYLGQRVEFDRSVCSAYSFSLARADLSHIIGHDETVFVKLKSYNSYCVEKLWLGFATGGRKEGSLDPYQVTLMKEDLERKGLTQAGLDVLVKGQFSPRHYIPLPTQTLHGIVVSLHEKDTFATSLTIKSETGDMITAERDKIYVHGHWMGRADLAYCLAGEQVCYEMSPRYGQEDDSAALVWLGGRPYYLGMGTFPHITTDSSKILNNWLVSKKLDLHSFKALIEGMLPSKKRTEEAASKSGADNLNLDPDTLAQAALLQKMKSQMGKEKVMDLLKSFLDNDEDSSKDTGASSSSKTRDQDKYYSSQSTTATFSSSPKESSTAAYNRLTGPPLTAATSKPAQSGCNLQGSQQGFNYGQAHGYGQNNSHQPAFSTMNTTQQSYNSMGGGGLGNRGPNANPNASTQNQYYQQSYQGYQGQPGGIQGPPSSHQGQQTGGYQGPTSSYQNNYQGQLSGYQGQSNSYQGQPGGLMGQQGGYQGYQAGYQQQQGHQGYQNYHGAPGGYQNQQGGYQQHQQQQQQQTQQPPNLMSIPISHPGLGTPQYRPMR